MRERAVSSGACTIVIALIAACNSPNPIASPVEAPRTSIALGTPMPDTVARNAAQLYSVVVKPGVTYTVSITALSDSATSLRVDNGGAISLATRIATPKDFTVVAATSTLRIDVAGASLRQQRASFVVTAIPAPIMTAPIVGTSGAILLGTPTIAWVATRSTSRYYVRGLSGTHVISIVGLTAAADLHVYADETYSSELDCTARNAGARECAVTTPSAAFAVTAGGVNRDGAGYVILVW